jgi:hypothetical protein
MRCSRPLPISLLDPCIGSMEACLPKNTFRWPPFAGSNVQPCFSSHRLNWALVMFVMIQQVCCTAQHNCCAVGDVRKSTSRALPLPKLIYTARHERIARGNARRPGGVTPIRRDSRDGRCLGLPAKRCRLSSPRPKAAIFRPLPCGSLAGVRSSCESPAPRPPPWIRAHTPDLQPGRRRRPIAHG